MLKGLFQIRADTPTKHITALVGDEAYRGIQLSPGLLVEQIDAIDKLLITRPNLTVAINQAETIPELAKLHNAGWLQIFFSRGDDPIESSKLLPALRLPALRGLRLHAYWLHDLTFLDELPPQLEFLSLDEETDRPKVGLDSLRRFRHLRQLTLSGPCRGYGALADLTCLQELNLAKVGADPCAFLAALTQLEHLHLGCGSLSELSVVGTLPRLRLLSLFELKRLSDVAFLSDCRALQWLDLHTMPGVTGLPSLGRNLLVLLLEALHSLADFQGVSSASGLELFSFVATKKPTAVPGDLLPVLTLPSLRHVKAGFGGKRLNEEFGRLALQHGKAWNAPDWDAYRARVALSSARQTPQRSD